ncbi:phenoloxidase-activating factor 1-like isoform X1 [Tribolium madens]|uniref:phenoloxidase-activating factor 1-like isoform X1 n=1 Tax=Tribolium madens TaxID=41895 RepID=UPI001CF74308|nr:phenoloxidase-activating factor 1-like isoform X1 [Tribolium madens]XP_044260045.1 phenoloxidase-activating factor 1-like isoform X1 [Tribolium madens]
MIVGKVFSVRVLLISVLWLLQTTNYVSTTKIECIPLKLCPMAMKLIKTKPYAPETIEFLRYSHCGFDGHDAKVWCTIFLYCKTPDSRNGICKNIKECDSFIKYVENVDTQDPVVRKYLKEYQCSTNQDPHVKICCPDEGKYNDIFTSNDVHERFSNYFPDPSLGECGKQNSDNKIVGGTETYLDEFPWLALLKYVNGNKIRYSCAGSLIHEQYVLTAAHCVDPQIIKQKELGKLQNVILGEYDTRNETDCIYQKFGSDCADPPQVFTPKDYIIHPNYDSSSMLNDIAIIRLDRKAKFSDYVQPICLPPKNLKLQGNESFTISGWGRTESEDRSPVKRKAIVRNTNKKRCDANNGRRGISDRQICVGQGDGVDSCYGDSGGPLMLETQTKNNSYATFVVGLVSYGYGRLCGNFPGVYTYLPAYLEWIEQQLR